MCLAFFVGWHDKATSQKFRVALTCLRFESGAPAIAGAHSKGTARSKTSVFAFGGRVLLLLAAELDAKHIPNAGVGEPPKNGESPQERSAGRCGKSLARGDFLAATRYARQVVATVLFSSEARVGFEGVIEDEEFSVMAMRASLCGLPLARRR
jgi:hypothetical protein